MNEKLKFPRCEEWSGKIQDEFFLLLEMKNWLAKEGKAFLLSDDIEAFIEARHDFSFKELEAERYKLLESLERKE